MCIRDRYQRRVRGFPRAVMECVECLYCGACGLPAEYCEFNGKDQYKNTCTPWLLSNMPRDWLIEQKMVAEGDEEGNVEGMANVTLGDGAAGEDGERAKGPQTTKKGAKLGAGDKVMPGGKVKKKQPVCILVQRLQRNKRKFVTVVIGLEHFGVRLKDAAQAFKKKFSCGSSVVVGENGKPDEIDIQGDFLFDCVDFMVKKFGAGGEVTKENIFVLDNGKRICATEM
eukprot:TRINITY_DN8115_c0_g1_i6.p1 TRINITY_DN8115_c0_g1~~TRINITY_DN8115_c0_g1_i6.p1  ORF type:complete len:227 (+),score=67.41 TRINITY_DN8115_c0_g1_i6:71-751(+)